MKEDVIRRLKGILITRLRYRKRTFLAVIISVCIIVGCAAVFALYSGTVPRAVLLPTAGWGIYHDANGISLKFPSQNNPTEQLDGAASGYNTPSGQSASDDGSLYQIRFPDPSTSGLGQFELDNEETTTPTGNLLLTVTLSTKANVVQTGSARYSHLQTIGMQGGFTYEVGVQNKTAFLLVCTSSGGCSPLIHRQNKVYPYAVASISAAEGDRYGGGTINLSSHNYAVMETILSTLNFDATATNTSTTVNQGPCYAVTRKPVYDNIYLMNISSVDPNSHTITVDYIPPSTAPEGLNAPLPQTYSKVFTIPASAQIVGGGDCHSDTFDDLRVGDMVSLYKSSPSADTISIVYNNNG